jgi:hypothetical protein
MKAARQSGGLGANKQALIEPQLRTLREADIVVVNEVDLRINRTRVS